MPATLTAVPTTSVSKRYDFILLFDVQDGNPNGDPDNGNLPRMDPQSLQGLVTDGCLKRKIRNAVAVLGDSKPGTDMYFQTQDAAYEKRILNLIHESAYSEANADVKKKGKEKMSEIAKARAWMCKNFYDVRAFGAVMSTGDTKEKKPKKGEPNDTADKPQKEKWKYNCGQVRGPVQLTFARSIDQILPLEHSITRKSVTKKEDADKEIEKKGTLTGTMGRKNTVPYALYRCHGFVNACLAEDTGFTEDDLKLLWEALKGLMWEIDRSAARGLMCTRGLYVFEHDSKLGNAPAHELFDMIAINWFGPDAAPRKFDDYKPRIKVPPEGEVRPGVRFHRLVHWKEG